MGDIKLTCDETPMAWPSNMDPADVPVCTTCALNLTAFASGSLQILTRRFSSASAASSAAGDGVNIEESSTVAADFRGQRYSLEEVVFHMPGLHIFPGQTEVYPAEVHIHLHTNSAPQRFLTVVVPVSHRVNGPGTDWFAAAAAQPDPAAQRPNLTSILSPGSRAIVFLGPDLRGRTADAPAPAANCNSTDERQFFLVMTPANIRAMDLERIPREGSLSTDPRNMPAQGVKAAHRVPRDRLLKATLMAVPGVAPLSSNSAKPQEQQNTELECQPLQIREGRNVVDTSDGTIDLATLLGYRPSNGPNTPGTGMPTIYGPFMIGWFFLVWFVTYLGIFLADRLFYNFVWALRFTELREHSVIKLIFYLVVSAITAFIAIFFV